MSNLKYLVMLFLSHWILVSAQEVREVEVCERENLTISCPPGTVVLTMTALFGRMREGRCAREEYGALGCQVDVLQKLDSRCSGLQSCSVGVSLLYVPDVCPRELTGYVQATYTCIHVMSCDSCEAGTHLHASSTSGIISGLSSTSNCGSKQCPWLLRAEPGQQINFTLYHFSQNQNSVHDKRYQTHLNTGSMNPRCRHHIATIRALRAERAGEEVISDVRICDNTPRVSSFLVDGHTDIELILQPAATANKQPKFLLEYQVLGCPAVDLPEGSKATRTDQELTIRCENGAGTWHLTCGADHAWVGKYGTCHQETNRPDDNGGNKPPDGNQDTPKSVWVLVICAGLLIGILFGASLLVAVAYCFKGSSGCRTYHRDEDSSYRDQHTIHMTPEFHRCEKHGQLYPESTYQCTHTLQHTLPPQCTLTRPDLCMQGFRPVPEGDTASLDSFIQESAQDTEVANNVMNKLKIYEQQRTNTLRDNRANNNPVCSSFKPNTRENISAL